MAGRELGASWDARRGGGTRGRGTETRQGPATARRECTDGGSLAPPSVHSCRPVFWAGGWCWGWRGCRDQRGHWGNGLPADYVTGPLEGGDGRAWSALARTSRGRAENTGRAWAGGVFSKPAFAGKGALPASDPTFQLLGGAQAAAHAAELQALHAE